MICMVQIHGCLGKILGRVDGLLEESDEAVQTD